MPLAIPPELKKITPYIRRAEELDRDKANPESRLVAFYCRQYAVHTGINHATSAPGKTCLGAILGQLEGEKAAMDSFTKDEAKFLCRKFADKIFDKADLEDRAGEATKETAKTFYAAASFLEILQQFYQENDESEEVADLKKRAVYSKWKATEILKAIKAGRQPTPGGYGEDEEDEKEDEKEEKEETQESNSQDDKPQVEDVSDEEDAPTNQESWLPPVPPKEPEDKKPMEPEEVEKPEANDKSDEGTEVELGPPPSYPMDLDPPSDPAPAPAPVVFKPPLKFNPPAPPPPMPAPPTVKPLPSPEPEKKKNVGFLGFGKKKNGKVTKAEMEDAKELTKFALAALDDKRVDLAAERLHAALKVLGR